MQLADFAILMKKRADNLPVNVNKVKQEVAELILDSVAHETPADTSLAISNWIVTLGAVPHQGIIPPHDPGLSGSTAFESASQTVEDGNAVIAQAKPNVAIHIANNVPYIGLLNEGYSNQAPAGFVEAAALKASKLIDNAKVITGVGSV